MFKVQPIFMSHYSIGKSILTLAPADKLDRLYPVSVFTIAELYKLKEIYLLDTSFSGFIEAYNNSRVNNNLNLRFGVQLIVCKDINEKTPESIEIPSKVNIWMLNTSGYTDLCKIYTVAATTGFYHKPRIDWKTLKEMWTPNLKMTIPFYSSFLHNNLLKRDTHKPEFLDFFKPVFHDENHNLPFDSLISDKIGQYTKNYNFEKLKSHVVYYYGRDDVVAFQVFKCVSQSFKRTTLDVPNLEHFSSDSFSWESCCDLNNIEFIKNAIPST